MPKQLQEVRGEVQSTNDKGFKINDEWVNYSRYLKGDKPNRGDSIVAMCDGKFVNEITIVGAGSGGSRPSETFSSRGSSTGESAGDRSKSILRQVALKASAEFHTTQSTDDIEKVIETARAFEAYLNEPFEAVADQVGAPDF